MSHQHNLSCLEAGPSGSLVCNITGETTAAKPPTPPAVETSGYDLYLGAPGSKLKASLRRDRLTGRLWLMFVGRPDASIITDLKAAGWRWSGFRKEWQNPSRYARVPPSIEAIDDGLVDYASERSERLEVRAGKHEAKSEAAHKRFETISSGIPLGQPILVGHHSEAHHRRDIARIQSAVRQSVEHGREASRLSAAATSSERHQAYLQTVPVIQRRLDRLRADLRSMERTFNRTPLPGQEWKPEDRADYQRRMDIKRNEIAENETALAAAGGPRTFEIAPGDTVRAAGRVYRVASVGPKNFLGIVAEGGAAGMKLRVGKEDIQEIMAKSSAPLPGKPKAPKSGNVERDQMIRFIYSKKPSDYRGRTDDGKHSVMTYDKGTRLIVLENTTDEEIRKLAADAGWKGPPVRKTSYSPEERLAVLRELNAEGYHAKRTVEGAKLTGMLAKTILQVHDQLSPENQAKLLSNGMPQIATLSLKMLHHS
jgi:hypothetical protein